MRLERSFLGAREELERRGIVACDFYRLVVYYYTLFGPKYYPNSLVQ